MADAFELGAFIIARRKADRLHLPIELLGAALDGPLRLEGRKNALDLVAIYPVAALIRASIRSVLNLASRNGLGNDLSDLRYAEVFLGPADIEGLVMYGRDGRFEDC